MTGLKSHSPNSEISAPKLAVSQPSVISAIRAIRGQILLNVSRQGLIKAPTSSLLLAKSRNDGGNGPKWRLRSAGPADPIDWAIAPVPASDTNISKIRW